jgi:hypothetical protein
MALYVDPKPTDMEIIEAIRYRYPISVQRAMLNMQLTFVGETLDLLKRVEIIETHEIYGKGQSLNSARGHNNSRTEST